jgi:signal transduction histidine kinase
MLVLSLALTWTFVSETHRWLIRNLEEKGLSQIDEIAGKIAPALKDRDKEKVSQLLEESFTEAEVAYLGVIDSEEKIFAERLRRLRFLETPGAIFESARKAEGPTTTILQDRVGQTTYFFLAPVSQSKQSGQQKVGAVVLGISSHYIQRDIREIVGITLPLYAAAMIMSCILVFFLLSRGLRPLGDVARLTSQIAQGDFSQRITVSRRDEIGVLAQSFNVMAEALNERETRRRQAEEALAKKAEELTRSNTELQHFAFIASHDLQEPLRTLASYVQLLAHRYKGKLDSDADEFIAFAVEGATRMQDLINALLAYSRIETKGKDLEPTPCDRVLETALKDLQLVIENSRAIVNHDLLPTVMADATQLRQLFQNLIGNAVKFRGNKPPVIHVSAERNGKAWVFSVRDNGIGIDPQFFERIFVIFQRLHSKQDYPGIGVGLTLCKKIVERHGGRIWVESKPGEGATFRFTIPV